MSRGDIYLADLNPSRGSEQAGIRPVAIVQREEIDRFTQTVFIVPLTSNLRRLNIPGTFTLKKVDLLKNLWLSAIKLQLSINSD